MKFIFRKFITGSSRVCSTRTNKALHQTLENLAKDTTIKICKIEKGNGAAILDTNDYNAKLDAIIGDKSKFKKVCCNSNKHPLIAKEDSIVYYVRKFLKKHYDNIMMAYLIPSGSSPGKLYGVIMGNPLWDQQWLIFLMAHLEEKTFAEKSNGPLLLKLYLRYIDDVYAIFDSNQNCDEFLPILNAQHQSVKSTVEKATDSLPFLEVKIKFDEFGFKTSVWRKPTGL